MTKKLLFTKNMIVKPATCQEAKWTKVLAPTLYIDYKDNNLYLKRIYGLTLAKAGEKDSRLYLKAAKILGQLHSKALKIKTPSLSSSANLNDSLQALWEKTPLRLSWEKNTLLSSCDELFLYMKSVKMNGLYLDANPNNWMIDQGNLIAIDFGHVSRASFASDLAQLFDYRKISIPFDLFFLYWSEGLQAQALAKTAKKDFPIVRIFSILCRAPFHCAEQRLSWYHKCYKFCQIQGLKVLASALSKVCNLIQKNLF